MAILNLGATGDVKNLLVIGSLAVMTLTIVVHIKNLRRMGKQEKSHDTRLSLLEAEIKTLKSAV